MIRLELNVNERDFVQTDLKVLWVVVASVKQSDSPGSNVVKPFKCVESEVVFCAGEIEINKREGNGVVGRIYVFARRKDFP